jgi:L-seryl-tRNA(Ser) seleniumtransferase
LPTLRFLARPQPEIEGVARRLLSRVQAAVGTDFVVGVIPCASQIGSGALPTATIPSAGLAVRPAAKRGGASLSAIAAALRRLPMPIIGRIEDKALILDLRCLEDEAGFLASLAQLDSDEMR